jgi:hypothetical protein
MAINNFNVGVGTTSQLTRYRYVATGGETSVSGADADSKTLSYTVGLEQVFLNGVNLVRGQDYTATDGTSVGALTALVASDVVEVFAYVPFNIANALTVSTVDAKGDLLVGTGADAVGRLAVGTDNYSLVADSSASTGVKWLQSQNIVQIVSNTYSTTTNVASGTYADTGLSASITPTSTSNKVIVFVNQSGVNNNTNNTGTNIKLLRGATDLVTFAVAYGYSYNGSICSASTVYVDSPNTTSSTTYKTQQARYTGATATSQTQSNGDVSTILLMEVTP